MIKNFVFSGIFKDSVVLMSASQKVKDKIKVDEISAMMGTDGNKELLKNVGLLTKDGEKAKNDDLIVAAKGKEDKILEAKDYFFSILSERQEKKEVMEDKSFDEMLKETDIVYFSIPGIYVYPFAKKAIINGKDLMIFSDNVTIEEEIDLKRLAKKKDVLVMGPDAGTAIYNGVYFGFVNNIRKGEIGIVAAAGTGIQEVSSLIHNMGYGVSQAIGVGGRDIKKKVGGISMLKGIDILQKDKDTKVIVVISKPPDEEVKKRVLQKLKKGKKKFVINFIGTKSKSFSYASTLKETAEKAVYFLTNKRTKKQYFMDKIKEKLINNFKFNKATDFIRGLYSGGTLANEAIFILKEKNIQVYSNISKDKKYLLKTGFKSFKNTIIDMGEDEFTRGKPHPMIDFSLRKKRILKESNDKNVKIIFFDLVLGYNSSSKPASEIVEVIRKIKRKDLKFFASITGVEEDIQILSKQIKILENEGIITFTSHTDMISVIAQCINKK